LFIWYESKDVFILLHNLITLKQIQENVENQSRIAKLVITRIKCNNVQYTYTLKTPFVGDLMMLRYCWRNYIVYVQAPFKSLPIELWLKSEPNVFVRLYYTFN